MTVPSPRRVALELAVLWLAADVALLGCAVVQSPGPQSVQPLWYLAFYLMVGGQVAAAFIWVLLGPARWSEGLLFVCSTIGMVAGLFKVVLARLPEESYLAHVLNNMLLTATAGAVMHITSTTVIVLFFRWFGATLNAASTPPSPPAPSRVSLLDLFLLTTSAAVMSFIYTVVAPFGLPTKVDAKAAAFFEWIFIPGTILVMFAALSPRRPVSYIPWVAVPALVALAIPFLYALATLPQHTLEVLHIGALVTLFVAIYPLTLILSLEYLRWRGYALAWISDSSGTELETAKPFATHR